MKLYIIKSNMPVSQRETLLTRLDWKIVIPIIISILSIGLNAFQYFDNRAIKHERERLGLKLDVIKYTSDSIKLSSESIKSALDSIKLNSDRLALKQKYPLFEFSYYQMDVTTYNMLLQRNEETMKQKKLVKDHPLITSKYLKTDISSSNSNRIMVLMLKQVGGSIANEVQVEFDEFRLKSSMGFSFQSDIIHMLSKKTNSLQKIIELGQLESSRSVIIPLFAFNDNISGSHDSYSIINKAYIPKLIKFISLDGKSHLEPIRKMLDLPFSISVNMDERG